MNNQDNTNDSTALERHFEPKTLTALGLMGTSFSATVRYEHTQICKKGLAKLLGKLPFFDGKPTTLDIDLSCFSLNQSLELIDTIWYGNLRNANHSIRHKGDALFGARNFDESLTTQEEIHIRPNELDDSVHHLLFIINANRSLHYAQKGEFILLDNEENIAHAIDARTLPKGCRSMLLWHLSKKGSDWQLHIPKLALSHSVNDNNLSAILHTVQQYLNNR